MYDLEWYKGLAGMHAHNARAMWALLAYFGRPRSLVDFGCGDGWMVKTAQEAGVDLCVGVEASEAVREIAAKNIRISVADLTLPCDLQLQFDMVISCEVGEHLPEEAADTYCDTLARHVENTLVFTAAKVGQGGYNHINCQDQPYWREKLEKRGLWYDERQTNELRDIWRVTTGPLIWLPQNVQVFVHA